MVFFTVFILTLPTVTTDTDWITSHGGRYIVNSAGDIVEIELSSTWITDVDLTHIAKFEHVEKLALSHTRITDAGLEHLRRLGNVRELDLYYAEYVTDSGLGHLVDWTRLERLDLKGTKITSRSLEHISRLINLRSLDISFTAIDDDGFENLGSLLKLERLAIGGNRLTGSCLNFLSRLPSLVDLDVGGMQRVDSGLWGLALDESNLRQIGSLRHLRILRLNGANLNDRGADRPGSPLAIRKELKNLSALKGLVNLEVLDLSCTPVNAGNLESLISLPKLREIRLGMAQNIEDDAVSVLAQMKALEAVYVAGTRLTPQAMVKIRAR